MSCRDGEPVAPAVKGTRWESSRLGARRLVVVLALALSGAVACSTSPEETASEETASEETELEESARVEASPVVELDSGTNERLQAIDVGDGLTLWASGIAGTVARSRDGGATWSTLRVPGAQELELRDVEALDARRVFVLAAGPGEESRIFGTEDGGESWRESWRNREPEAFYDCLDFWPSGRGIAFSDSVGGRLLLVASVDGEEWSAAPVEPVALPGEGGFAASGTCLLVGEEGEAWIGTGAGGAARVFRTEDHGESWDVSETPLLAAGDAAGVLSLARDEGRALFAFGGDIAAPESRGRRIARSGDGGRTWALSAAEPEFAGAIYGGAARGAGETAELLAVGPGGAAYSPDAGASWIGIDSRGWWAVAWTSSGDALLAGPEGRLARWSPDL